MSNAGIIVTPSNNSVFTNSSIGDMLMFTYSNNQKILIGTNSNSSANITLTSNVSYFNNGNVGINTSNPAYQLDVAGQTRLTYVPIITQPVYISWSNYNLFDNNGNITNPSGAGQLFYFGWNTPTQSNWTSTTTAYMNSHVGQNVPYTGLYILNYNVRLSAVCQCDFFISKNAGIALNNFPPLADGGGITTGGVTTVALLNANTDYVNFGIYFLSFTTWYNVVSANASITLLQRIA
jgi:hypothetical protein